MIAITVVDIVDNPSLPGSWKRKIFCSMRPEAWGEKYRRVDEVGVPRRFEQVAGEGDSEALGALGVDVAEQLARLKDFSLFQISIHTPPIPLDWMTEASKNTNIPSTSSAEAPASPPRPLLQLEAPPAAEDAAIKLNVGTSEPVSLYDQLGPTIVASDGSASSPSSCPYSGLLTSSCLPPALTRIGNWKEMGEMERSRVLRVLGARNKERLEERKAALGLD